MYSTSSRLDLCVPSLCEDTAGLAHPRRHAESLLSVPRTLRSVAYMVKVGTPVPHGYEVKTLCRHGPFEHFKHPQYTGLFGSAISASVVLDSACEPPSPFASPMTLHAFTSLLRASGAPSLLPRLPICAAPSLAPCPCNPSFHATTCLSRACGRVVHLACSLLPVPGILCGTARGEVHEGQVWKGVREVLQQVRFRAQRRAPIVHAHRTSRAPPRLCRLRRL
jgi:hypothetical protein